jgi:hypothetical protein
MVAAKIMVKRGKASWLPHPPEGLRVLMIPRQYVPEFEELIKALYA